MNIQSISLERLDDVDPDTSHLGEYSDTPAPVHIDRKERGDQERNTFRYFNLGCGDAEYIEADYKRMEALNRGDWCYIGIRAKAVVEVGGVIQTIHSGGLWGIESDSDASHFSEVEGEELGQLRGILEEMGFTPEQIEQAEKAGVSL